METPTWPERLAKRAVEVEESAIPLTPENMNRIMELMGEDQVQKAQRDALDFVWGRDPEPQEPRESLIAEAYLGRYTVQVIEIGEQYKVVGLDNREQADLSELYDNHQDAFDAFRKAMGEMADAVLAEEEEGEE